MQQIGLALAGAAALWGIFFYLNAGNAKEEGKKKACTMIAEKLFIPLSFGFVIALLGAFLKFYAIAYYSFFLRFGADKEFLSTPSAYGNYLVLFWIALTLVWLATFILSRKRKEEQTKRLNLFYVLTFIVVFILISFPTGIQGFDLDRLFFIKHGFPLIFTIGTVIVIDFIFFFTRASLRAKRQIYPFLTTLNKIIWLGLGIHLFVDWGSFRDITLNSQFMVTQAIAAIIIINGALFTGPLMEKLIDGVSERQVKPLDQKWVHISNISSVIAFSSWTSLIYISFFRDFNLSFSTLFLTYAIKTLAVYGIYLLLEWLTDIPLSVVNTN